MRYVILALLLTACSGATVKNEWVINAQGDVTIRIDSAQETTKTPTVNTDAQASFLP